ncbi:hypothetical protein TNCV_3223561 [Trichonephila clavipes]|nr:hypothetical protein TNCV_3223561 [Trichonephila clavipes]
MSSTIGEKISHETIRRTLHQYGFHGRSPIRKPLIKLILHAAIVFIKDHIRTTRSGRGSLVVKVTDSWPACHQFQPSTAEDPPCRGAMHVKSVKSSNILNIT